MLLEQSTLRPGYLFITSRRLVFLRSLPLPAIYLASKTVANTPLQLKHTYAPGTGTEQFQTVFFLMNA